jgi:transposase
LAGKWSTPCASESGAARNGRTQRAAKKSAKGKKKLNPPFETEKLPNRGCYRGVDLENIDYKKHPAMNEVTILETVLEPGEIIFTPIGWWHSSGKFNIQCVEIARTQVPNHQD